MLPARITLAALALLLVACPGDEPDPDAEGEESAATDSAAADQATADEKTAEKADEKASETAAVEAPPAGAAPPAMLAASHMLIQYQGSMRADKSITRTKEEALVRAKEAAAKATGGGDFTALAAEYSDGPTAKRGGSLGSFEPGRMIPEFSAAVMKLEVGAITPEPVESSFGFHVIRRDKAEFFGAKHILVQYQGSMRAAPTITRTKEEAMTRATDALGRAKKGEDFAALAKEFSDGPTRTRGGDLGTFGKGMMAPSFEAAVAGAEPNALVPELVETPFGYHIIFRTQ